MVEKKRPVLRLFSRLFILLFVFLLGFGLAKRWEQGAIKADSIGVVEIKGIIKDARSTLDTLVNFEKNRHIKAILLRINSPGGAVGPSQEIYLELIRARKKKPIVASLGTIAASGAYYVASAANKIVAAPGTLTGSIGVKLELANVERLLDKLGIEPMVLKSVPYKDIGSPFREMKPEEKKILQGVLNDVQRQFVEAVAKGRNLPVKKVEKIADGSVFTAKKAKQLGLVDVLGNFEDAVSLAARMAGIKGEPHLYYPKEKLSWRKMFLDSVAEVLMEQIQKIKISY